MSIERQPDLFGAAPRAAGSETSAAAARSIEPVRMTDLLRVLLWIADCGERGATDDEIEYATSMKHQSASARRWELRGAGLVRDSEVRRPTRSGRSAIAWVATERAREWLKSQGVTF